MTAIRVKPNELIYGLQQWSRETKKQFKSYAWLGTASTLPFVSFYSNPGGIITTAAVHWLVMETLKKQKAPHDPQP